MENQPEDSSHVMGQVLDSLAVGVFTVDDDWNIRFFNTEAERLTGVCREEALGRKCYQVFHTRD